MGHIPHLYLPGPWEGALIGLRPDQDRHLRRVLRMRDGEPVSYTDGRGMVGTGQLDPAGVIRGEERSGPAPASRLTLAVAPPRSPDRARDVVEKLAELGVDRLVWLTTRRGEAAPPRPEKAVAWAVSALEQSRGARLLEVTAGEDVGTECALWCAVPGGDLPGPVEGDLTILIGPEGGFEDGEIPSRATRVGLGPRVLRVPTAAVVAAVIGLERLGRLRGPSFRPTENSSERLEAGDVALLG